MEDAHRVDRELSTKRKAEKDAAKAAAAKMTPEERAAARKAKRAKPPVGVPLDRRYREPLPPGGRRSATLQRAIRERSCA